MPTKTDPYTVIKGDATQPEQPGPNFIVHVCNNIGAWGAGFVMAISRRWSEPQRIFELVHPQLGDIQIVPVHVTSETVDGLQFSVSVVNMVAQHGIGRFGGGTDGTEKHPYAGHEDLIDRDHPLQYAVLEHCLEKVYDHVRMVRGSVHMPRIGCGLAGGSWDRVDAILHKMPLKRVPTFVYDFA